MARPTKYSPEVVAKIIQAIDMGATQELAAGFGGISTDTFHVWRDRYPDFAAKLREAEGRAAVKWLAKIEAAATDDWKAAAWKLERRHPHAYGKTVSEQQHSGEVGIRRYIGVDLSALSDEELALYERLAEKVQGDGS